MELVKNLGFNQSENSTFLYLSLEYDATELEIMYNFEGYNCSEVLFRLLIFDLVAGSSGVTLPSLDRHLSSCVQRGFLYIATLRPYFSHQSSTLFFIFKMSKYQSYINLLETPQIRILAIVLKPTHPENNTFVYEFAAINDSVGSLVIRVKS